MRGRTLVSPYELPDHEQGPIRFIGSSSGVRQSGKPDGNGIISTGHALIWRIERKQTSSWACSDIIFVCTNQAFSARIRGKEEIWRAYLFARVTSRILTSVD